MPSGTATPSKTVFKHSTVLMNGTQKHVAELEIRTFLWDNPELRRAFREASKKETTQREIIREKRQIVK